MPLDKNMSHEEMIKELIDSYKKTGKIGATEPRDMKHALEIANAVAYNIGESKEVKAIERNVEEMTLDEILESMERIISAKEKELGIFSETLKTPYEVIFWNEDEKWEFSGAFETLKEAKDFVLNHISDYPDTVSFEIRKENKSLGGGKPNVTKEDIDTLVSEALEENPKVKVTLDSGETFETEVDPATSEDELEKQYKAGTEINVGKEGQERKAKIKSATLTKQVGEDFEEDNKYYDIFKNMDLDKEALQHSLKVLKANKKGSKSQEQIDAIEKILKEDLENPLAVIENPTDVVSLDIPLLMRLLEWSREQAGEDVDLHVLTENLVEAMKDTEFLTMDDYERLVPCEECDSEESIGEKFVPRNWIEKIQEYRESCEEAESRVRKISVYDEEKATQGFSVVIKAIESTYPELDNLYNSIFPNEEEPMGESFSDERADIEQTYGVDLSKNLKFDGLDEVPNEWLEFIEDSNYTFNNVQDLFKQQGYIIERVNEPAIETNYITFKVFKDQMGAKPTGVMEVTRVDLLKNNAYDVAYKIQKELEYRYPNILECDGSSATTMSGMGVDTLVPMGRKNKVMKPIRYKKLDK